MGVVRGSWDLVTRVISKVTIFITTYSPNSGTCNLALLGLMILQGEPEAASLQFRVGGRRAHRAGV